MRASEQLINELKEIEKFREKAYKALRTEKYYTIGYGHYGRDVKAGSSITLEGADKLLRTDLKMREDFVNKLGVAKTQGEFDALVDFCYNCGTGALENSVLLKYIRAGRNEKLIKGEFMKWCRSGGKQIPGLMKRREWEVKRFFSND